MKTVVSSLEILESRIVLASGSSFLDLDGDKVTITLSSGTLADTTTAAGLVLVDLTGATPDADFFMTVTKVPGGDGLCNVGYINPTGVDLGHVTVKGDLGQIDAGSDTATAGDPVAHRPQHGPARHRYAGHRRQLGSDILGALGALDVSGDVKDAFLRSSRLAAGSAPSPSAVAPRRAATTAARLIAGRHGRGEDRRRRAGRLGIESGYIAQQRQPAESDPRRLAHRRLEQLQRRNSHH